MGGVVIKPKIIILTKKKLMIYAAVLIALVIGLIALISIINDGASRPSSGYTYLKYKDGIYIANEKTEYGNIKVEVTIKNSKIKDIKLIEFPQQYLDENATLKDELPQVIYSVIKNQDIQPVDNPQNTAYVVNKVLIAIRKALDQSLISQ